MESPAVSATTRIIFMALSASECRGPRIEHGSSGEWQVVPRVEPVCREVSWPGYGPMRKSLNGVHDSTIATRVTVSQGAPAFRQPTSEPADKVRFRCSAHEGFLPIRLRKIRWTVRLESSAFDQYCPGEIHGTQQQSEQRGSANSSSRRTGPCLGLRHRCEPIHRCTGVELWKLWHSRD